MVSSKLILPTYSVPYVTCLRLSDVRMFMSLCSGVAITGELFETRDSTKEHPQSFFSNITVATRDLHIVFSQTGSLDKYMVARLAMVNH